MKYMKLKIEKEQHVNKTFKLNLKLVDEMYAVCDAKDISLNKLADICIRYALDNLDNDGNEVTGLNQ